MVERRIYRSSKDRILCGVCSGIAKYFNVDPVIVRLLWIALTLLSFGVGALLYVITCLVIPKEGGESNSHANVRGKGVDGRSLAALIILVTGSFLIVNSIVELMPKVVRIVNISPEARLLAGIIMVIAALLLLR